ncbi:MAG: chorismate mutase [SAR202 cluster bacterium]|nr:chorismate mutase [SAR202 cluster bacterium]|tara:strand:+ start:53267 stop:53632 length:366 start_codon:yes stop_codon:yes gene_type:complete
MNQLRGIRGATTSNGNSKSEIEEATLELLQSCINANNIKKEDIAAAIFTISQDITEYNPATVARKKLNWDFVPLLDVYQAPISSDLKFCIRVLLLINSDKSQEELSKKFQYLKDAKHLREN